MTWQQRRRRELWGSALTLLALFGGLWGIIIKEDYIVLISLFLFITHIIVVSIGWKSKCFFLAFIMFLTVAGQKLALLSDASVLANAVLPVLLLESLLHMLAVFGNSHRLMEKLVESGEFQRDHEEFERVRKGEKKWSESRFSS